MRYHSNFFVHIPLINENLFCKYFVRLSVGNATKGFATYGCFHPCYLYISVSSSIRVEILLTIHCTMTINLPKRTVYNCMVYTLGYKAIMLTSSLVVFVCVFLVFASFMDSKIRYESKHSYWLVLIEKLLYLESIRSYVRKG